MTRLDRLVSPALRSVQEPRPPSVDAATAPVDGAPLQAATVLQDAAEPAPGLGDRLVELVTEGADWFVANGVDGIGLALALGFAVLGLWHGLWWQVVRFVGLLGAVLAARALSPDLAVWIGSRWSGVDPLIISGSAWLVVFLAALSLAVFVGRLGRRLLEALELSALDRLGGLLAGVATGLLLHAAGVAVVLQLSPGDWSRRNIEGTRSAALVQLLGDRARVLFDDSTAFALESRRTDEQP